MAKNRPAVERDNQETLPGVLPKPSKALLAKVEDLEATRYRRMELQDEEKQLEEAVVTMMEKQGVQMLSLSSGRNAKLTRIEAKEKVKFITPKADT